ncbi:putative uncharacterized protein DDB_G0286901 [Leptopilina heterotoma]|uniref:putative uncharacterized protein DDB_G0286901 n=1 Tax=Leptopilina heterotoma TaxID=63436 RepID=UPI001CA8C7F7|nr:putative uncharacterized protein DDB_G0286901 [Leptopilina heterotoma]
MESLKLYPFHLVEFISKGKKVARCVDCVCLNWIRYDEETKKFMAKYIPPPYTEKTKAIFQMMVKQQLDVPDHWTEYSVNLVGHAGTYEEAEKRLDALNSKKNVYSSESDMNSTQKANAIKKLMKEKGSADINRELNDLPSLNDKLETTRDETFRDETKSNLDKDKSASDSEADESDYESNDAPNQPLKRKGKFKYDARKKRNIMSLTNSMDDENLLNTVDGFLLENSNLLQDDSEGPGSKDNQNLEFLDDNSNSLQHNSKGTGSKTKRNLESKPSTSTGKMNNNFNISQIKNSQKNSSSTNASSKRLVEISSNSNDSLLVRIIKEIQGLKHDIREVKNNLLTLTTMVENMAEYKDNLKISLTEQFKLNLPIKELHELEEFDIKLKTDEDY